MKSLSNTSNYSGEPPTIEIIEGSPEWDTALKNWIDGKNPTDSKEWKKGIFYSQLTYEEYQIKAAKTKAEMLADAEAAYQEYIKTPAYLEHQEYLKKKKEANEFEDRMYQFNIVPT